MISKGLGTLKANWETAADAQIDALVMVVSNSDAFNTTAEYQDYMRRELEVQKQAKLKDWELAAETRIQFERELFLKKISDQNLTDAVDKSDNTVSTNQSDVLSAERKSEQVANASQGETVWDQAEKRLEQESQLWQKDFENDIDDGLYQFQTAIGILDQDHANFLQSIDDTQAQFDTNLAIIYSYEKNVRDGIKNSIGMLENFQNNFQFELDQSVGGKAVENDLTSALFSLHTSSGGALNAKLKGAAAGTELDVFNTYLDEQANNICICDPSCAGNQGSAQSALDIMQTHVMTDADAKAKFQTALADTYNDPADTNPFGTLVQKIKTIGAGMMESQTQNELAVLTSSLRDGLNNNAPLSTLMSTMTDFMNLKEQMAADNRDYWSGITRGTNPYTVDISGQGDASPGDARIQTIMNYYASGRDQSHITNYINTNLDARVIEGLGNVDIHGFTDPYPGSLHHSNDNGQYYSQAGTNAFVYNGEHWYRRNDRFGSRSGYNKVWERRDESTLRITMHYNWYDPRADSNQSIWSGYFDELKPVTDHWENTLLPAIQTWEAQANKYKDDFAAWKIESAAQKTAANAAHAQGRKDLLLNQDEWLGQMAQEYRLGKKQWRMIQSGINEKKEEFSKKMTGSAGDFEKESKAIIEKLFSAVPSGPRSAPQISKSLQTARARMPGLTQEFLSRGAKNVPDSRQMNTILNQFEKAAQGIFQISLAGGLNEKVIGARDSAIEATQRYLSSAGYKTEVMADGRVRGVRQINSGGARQVGGDGTSAGDYEAVMRDQVLVIAAPGATALTDTGSLFDKWDAGSIMQDFAGSMQESGKEAQARQANMTQQMRDDAQFAVDMQKKFIEDRKDRIKLAVQYKAATSGGPGSWIRSAFMGMIGGASLGDAIGEQMNNQMSSMVADATGLPQGLFDSYLADPSAGWKEAGSSYASSATESLYYQSIADATGLPMELVSGMGTDGSNMKEALQSYTETLVAKGIEDATGVEGLSAVLMKQLSDKKARDKEKADATKNAVKTGLSICTMVCNFIPVYGNIAAAASTGALALIETYDAAQEGGGDKAVFAAAASGVANAYLDTKTGGALNVGLTYTDEDGWGGSVTGGHKGAGGTLNFQEGKGLTSASVGYSEGDFIANVNWTPDEGFAGTVDYDNGSFAAGITVAEGQGLTDAYAGYSNGEGLTAGLFYNQDTGYSAEVRHENNSGEIDYSAGVNYGHDGVVDDACANHLNGDISANASWKPGEKIQATAGYDNGDNMAGFINWTEGQGVTDAAFNYDSDSINANAIYNQENGFAGHAIGTLAGFTGSAEYLSGSGLSLGLTHNLTNGGFAPTGDEDLDAILINQFGSASYLETQRNKLDGIRERQTSQSTGEFISPAGWEDLKHADLIDPDPERIVSDAEITRMAESKEHNFKKYVDSAGNSRYYSREDTNYDVNQEQMKFILGDDYRNRRDQLVQEENARLEKIKKERYQKWLTVNPHTIELKDGTLIRGTSPLQPNFKNEFKVSQYNWDGTLAHEEKIDKSQVRKVSGY